jgi:proteic killer suppression protein
MEVRFSNVWLKHLSENYDLCVRRLGKLRAKKYFIRLNALLDANDLEELKRLPGHFHRLSGDRSGQCSCDLDQPYRLVFRPSFHQHEGNNDNEDQGVKVHYVSVEEIVDYH